MYDVIMSLGYNCEISFRLENYFGSINAMPFSWSYVMGRDKFPQVLENIDELFTGEVTLLEDNMICCENCEIKFHPRYDVLLKDGNPTAESTKEAVAELRERVAYLREKFKKLLESDSTILFLMKVENKGEEDNVRYIQEVLQVLRRKCVFGKFTLVAILEQNAITESIQKLEAEQLKIRTLKCFAPRKHTDTMGDVRGWKTLLREVTGVKSADYYKRLYRKRWQWFKAMLRKHLFGEKRGH